MYMYVCLRTDDHDDLHGGTIVNPVVGTPTEDDVRGPLHLVGRTACVTGIAAVDVAIPSPVGPVTPVTSVHEQCNSTTSRESIDEALTVARLESITNLRVGTVFVSEDGVTSELVVAAYRDGCLSELIRAATDWIHTVSGNSRSAIADCNDYIDANYLQTMMNDNLLIDALSGWLDTYCTKYSCSMTMDHGVVTNFGGANTRMPIGDRIVISTTAVLITGRQCALICPATDLDGMSGYDYESLDAPTSQITYIMNASTDDVFNVYSGRLWEPPGSYATSDLHDWLCTHEVVYSRPCDAVRLCQRYSEIAIHIDASELESRSFAMVAERERITILVLHEAPNGTEITSMVYGTWQSRCRIAFWVKGPFINAVCGYQTYDLEAPITVSTAKSFPNGRATVLSRLYESAHLTSQTVRDSSNVLKVDGSSPPGSTNVKYQ
eukprot:GHVR01037171.1.p1 GENE.GHVR01037171.1~~GHVR01037171.1.p1  ORF type:complete len:447 (+),score=13.00 GHVR01037171.1:36-1343(+)